MIPVEIGREQQHAETQASNERAAFHQSAAARARQADAQIAGPREAWHAEGRQEHGGTADAKEQGGDRGAQQQ